MMGKPQIKCGIMPKMSWHWQEPPEIRKAKVGVSKVRSKKKKKNPSQLLWLMATFPVGWLACSSASSCPCSLNQCQQWPHVFGWS